MVCFVLSFIADWSILLRSQSKMRQSGPGLFEKTFALESVCLLPSIRKGGSRSVTGLEETLLVGENMYKNSGWCLATLYAHFDWF